MSCLSEYCISTCKAKCCKRGKLPLLAEERAIFDSKRIDENGFYDLTGGCEFLINDKCSIYNKRPKMCEKYPFHEMGPLVIAITLCPAVEEGLLDQEIIKRKARKL